MCIRDLLRSRNVPFVTMLHRPMGCASRKAESLRTAGERVVKAVLVRSEGEYWLAVVPSTHRIDLQKLAAVMGVGSVSIATEDEVERVFHDCQRGAVPPFGALYGLKTVVDTHLAGQPELIVDGNMRHEGIRLRFRDFESVERPMRGRFAALISPPSRRRLRAAS